MMQGDYGYSFEYERPVSEVVGDRLYLTIMVSFVTIIVTWMIAFPIGIYSATHQYSWGDYGLTFVGLLGLATPNFLLALVMMYLANVYFGTTVGHLMDQKYLDEPMSWEKTKSILEHLVIPVIVIGTSGTAAMIRRLRANLLDELEKQYVVTARAKGVPPLKALVKYPLRMALNFFVADIGSLLTGNYLRGRNCRHRIVAGNHRPFVDFCTAKSGYVSCRFVPDVSGGTYSIWCVDFRYCTWVS